MYKIQIMHCIMIFINIFLTEIVGNHVSMILFTKRCQTSSLEDDITSSSQWEQEIPPRSPLGECPPNILGESESEELRDWVTHWWWGNTRYRLLVPAGEGTQTSRLVEGSIIWLWMSFPFPNYIPVSLRPDDVIARPFFFISPSFPSVQNMPIPTPDNSGAQKEH